MINGDILRDSWNSLGVAFYSQSSNIYTPEEAIISLVKSSEFPEDKKMMGIAIAWLKKYSKFVHVERLQNFTTDLNVNEMALLGGIAQKCIGFNDHRWKKIVSIALKKIKGHQVSIEQDSDFLLKKNGIDKDFSRFKIQVTPLALESDKKFFVKEKMLSKNPWLRMRLLFGANLRADVATLIYLKTVPTAYAAAKYLNCSTSAVYRNWQDLKGAGWDEDGFRPK